MTKDFSTLFFFFAKSVNGRKRYERKQEEEQVGWGGGVEGYVCMAGMSRTCLLSVAVSVCLLILQVPSLFIF